MRVLFTTHPASGHLHPLVPLARAAGDAGHDVRFAIAGSHVPAVERLGFPAFSAGADYEDPEVARIKAEAESHEGLEHAAVAIRDLFAGILAERMIPDLERIVAEWRPDLVVAEVTELASLLVARRVGLPRVNILFGLYGAVQALGDVAIQGIAPLWLRMGLGPIPDLDFFDTETSLVFAPPGYEIPGVVLPPSATLIRPVPFDQSGDESLPEWVLRRPRRPLVLATLGTVLNRTPGVLEDIARAAGEETLDLVMTVGRDRDPSSLGPVPGNVRVERYIPFSLLLPHCSAMIAHAGYGTVMAGLCNGLPMLLLPLGADQPLHAARCEALGAAAVIERGALSVAAIREGLGRILDDPSLGEHARAVRGTIEAMPGMDQAVRILEDRAAKGPSPIGGPA